MKKIVSLAVLAVVIGNFVIAGPSESPVTAQQAQPIPSANDDVRIVAGLLLAQELLNIASREAVIPEGMTKLATEPKQGWEAVGGTGLTSQARAAASSSGLASAEVLLAPANKEFQVTPNIKIKNPLLQRAGAAQDKMLKTVYQAMIEAEKAGQMELAYALASLFLTNGLPFFNFFDRGLNTGFQRIDDCLAGKDITLAFTDPDTKKEFLVECSKYIALRAVVATALAPGAFSFLGPLADPSIGCQELRKRATDAQATSWARLAAARAYVRGVQVFAGVFQPCIQPSEGQSEVDAFLAAAFEATPGPEGGFTELLEEITGLDFQLVGPPISGVWAYSSIVERRGLAKALEGVSTGILETLARREKPGDPGSKISLEISLAAYYELGNRWADKPEAQLRQLMTDDDATPAVRRAATKALLIQLGRAFDVQCLQSLANGQECK